MKPTQSKKTATVVGVALIAALNLGTLAFASQASPAATSPDDPSAEIADEYGDGDSVTIPINNADSLFAWFQAQNEQSGDNQARCLNDKGWPEVSHRGGGEFFYGSYGIVITPEFEAAQDACQSQYPMLGFDSIEGAEWEPSRDSRTEIETFNEQGIYPALEGTVGVVIEMPEGIQLPNGSWVLPNGGQPVIVPLP